MKPITLHPVKRAAKTSNRYCGPSALSILTGLDTKDTARLLRDVSGRPFIKGTGRGHMWTALKRVGFSVQPVHSALKVHGQFTCTPTLAQWSRQFTRETGATYLLVVGNHWAIVQGRRYACGLVPKPVPIKGCPKWRARVTETYKIDRVSGQRPATLCPPAPPRAKTDPARTEAKKLAAHYGIELEPAMGSRLAPKEDGVFVYPPIGLYGEDNDPLSGERGCYSWSEVLEAVNVYVDAVKARDLRLTSSLNPATPTS